MSTPISAAADAARESARQDNGQFGTQARAEAGTVVLASGRQLHQFSEGEGACWRDPADGRLHGVRIVSEPRARGQELHGADTLRVSKGGRLDTDRVTFEVARGELTGLRSPVGEEVPVDAISEGDWIMHEGRITEVGETDGEDDEDHDEDGKVLYLTDLDESAFYAEGDTVTRVDCSDRYISTEEGLAHAPGRTTEADFRDQYGVVQGPNGDETFEEVPAGTDVHHVWSQYEGELDDGRYDYVLVPGFTSGAINYVISEKPWSEEGSSVEEVNWN